MKKLIVICLTVVFLVFAGCSGQPNKNLAESPPSPASPTVNPSTPEPTVNPSTPEPTAAASTPQDAADEIILSLQAKDLDALNPYIHPEKGLLFSPYIHIESESAISFNAGELPALEDETLYLWGDYDGSGEPISLTFLQYYDKFVYDHDYLNAETVGWDSLLGDSTTIPNIKDVYPDSYLVDYHFSGFEEQYEGMDWSSLILVLEQFDGGWYISAIVHSSWTI